MIGFNATMRYVTNSKGELVVISLRRDRRARRARPRARAPQGAVRRATLSVRPTSRSRPAPVLANWDPLTRPIITGVRGQVKFENVEEGLTVAKQVDGSRACRRWWSSIPNVAARQGGASPGQMIDGEERSRSPAPTTR